MPKQLKNKRIIEQVYKRKDVDYYHNELKYMIRSVGYWSRSSDELQEFLDQDEYLTVLEPDEFCDFHENWESARCAGISARIHQHLHPRNLKSLARALYFSPSRQKYYIKTINSRLRCASTEQVVPLSIIELEQRYQYHLHMKDLKRRGLKSKYSFNDWRESDECVTFYDKPLYYQLIDYGCE